MARARLLHRYREWRRSSTLMCATDTLPNGKQQRMDSAEVHRQNTVTARSDRLACPVKNCLGQGFEGEVAASASEAT
jgi:hypothetical protein